MFFILGAGEWVNFNMVQSACMRPLGDDLYLTLSDGRVCKVRSEDNEKVLRIISPMVAFEASTYPWVG